MKGGFRETGSDPKRAAEGEGGRRDGGKRRWRRECIPEKRGQTKGGRTWKVSYAGTSSFIETGTQLRFGGPLFAKKNHNNHSVSNYEPCKSVRR